MFTGEATGSKLGIIAGASHPVQSRPRYPPVLPARAVRRLVLPCWSTRYCYSCPRLLPGFCHHQCCVAPRSLQPPRRRWGGRAARRAGCHAVSIHEESSNCLPFQLSVEDSAVRTGRKPDRGLIGATPRVRPGIYVIPCGEREHGRPAGAGQRSS